MVIVEVAPKEAAPPHFGPSTVTFQRGDVAALELRRNNVQVPLPVLQSGRYFSVTNVTDYKTKPPFHAAVYVFRASDFAGATKLDLKVVYDDANQRRETIIPPIWPPSTSLVRLRGGSGYRQGMHPWCRTNEQQLTNAD